MIVAWKTGAPATEAAGRSPKASKKARRNSARNASGSPDDAVRIVDHRLLQVPPGPTAHPFINDRLKTLRIPGLTNIDTFCQWASLTESHPSTAADSTWSHQVELLWSKALFDWATADPLIFYTVLQAVLDKRYNITGNQHSRDIAAINATMIPLLSDRISKPHELNGLEAMAITGLTFMAMRVGDFATAQVHQRAIQRIFDLTNPDRYLCLYVWWASLRLSAASCLPPFLRREVPQGWPVFSLAKEQLAKAQRSALRDMRTFGNVFTPESDAFYLCIRQLHEVTIIQDTAPDSVSCLIPPIYSICYDVCTLHAKVRLPQTTPLPPDHTALIEIAAIALKCCAWNKASFVGPHGGKVQQTILARAVELSSAIQMYDAASLAARFGMNPKAILWLFLVLSAEAYWYLPETRDIWLNWLSSAVKSLSLTSQSAFSRALTGYPCTGEKYWKRMVRAWQDLGAGNKSWQREMPDNRRGLNGEKGFGMYLGILNFQVDVE